MSARPTSLLGYGLYFIDVLACLLFAITLTLAGARFGHERTVAVLSLALQQLASRAAGLAATPTPGWLEPAVESALLLGMLGTISGMVSGFSGLSPEELEPGPLVYSLGRALRSSFVGFAIALVGVWTRARPS